MDLYVVGGSFAGLACARAAAVLGLEVVVVDRKPEPGAHPHTTGILVQEAASAIDIPRHLTRRVAGVRLYSPSLRSVDLDGSGYAFHATDLPGLMRWMAEETSAVGVEMRNGVRFEGARRVGSRFVVDGSRDRPRFIVGADGPRSRVAQVLGLDRNTEFLIGVEAEYRGIRGVDPDRLHVFLDRELAKGYIGWVVPGVDGFQVGLAARQGIRPDLPSFTAKIGRVFDMSGAAVVSHRAGPIPVGGGLRRIGGDGALLVGDAAGLVSPLTAGGIHNALHIGRLAGRAVADHLLDDGPDPLQVIEPLLPDFRWKRKLRLLWDHAPPNAVIDRLGFSRPALAAARLVFFHHRGLLSADGWRSLAEPAIRRAG